MAIVTIANLTGCGEVMYTNLAKKLNYRLVNRELMEYVAGISGLDIEDLKLMDEKKHSRLNVFLNNFIDLNLFSISNSEKIESKPISNYGYDRSPSGENFKYATEKVIRTLANDDNVIVVGRGSNIVLKTYPKALHLFLWADLQQRTQNIQKSMNMNEKEARKYAEETDVKKERFVKYYYNSDMNDHKNYDMYINLSMIDEKKAADIVADIITKYY